MLGSIPSDYIPYIDFVRLAELMLTDKEQMPDITIDSLNSNNRLIHNIRASEGRLMMAVSVGGRYSVQQMRDLVKDAQQQPPHEVPADPVTGVPAHWVGISGQQILAVLADLVWCQVIRRKRYPADVPQGKDASCEFAEKTLKMLQEGDQIFVLDGVEIHDPTTGEVVGVYDDAISQAGNLTGGYLWSNIYRARHLWGCKDGPCGPDGVFRTPWGGCK